MEHITRKEAINKGLKYYFTGNECKNGHIEKQKVTGGCFKCNYERNKKRQLENREAINSYHRKRYNPENRRKNYINNIETEMYHHAKHRSLRDNRKFTLKLEDIIIPKKCPVFNKPIIKGDKQWGPALDRIDNSKGYTKDNICVVSKRANRLKSDAQLEELKKIVQYIESNK